MLTFQPAIARDSQLIPLPRPIVACRVYDRWDFLKMKVPRLDGDHVAGPSREGVGIMIEGQIGSVSGALTLSESQMLQAVEQLRQALHVSGDDEGYMLSLFQTADATLFRYFRSCITTRCDIDLSSKHLFSYSLTIHAADPVLHEGVLP